MAKVQLPGAALECVDTGAGAPVVLVHGSASDLRTWQGQRDVLARHYRVIAYSRRHHWPNEPIAGGADYSMIQHVDDLQALLGALNAAPAHLVGHSYGAFVCLLLALRDPALVRSLVLAEPPALTLFVSSEPKPWELLKVMLARPRTAAAIVRFGATGVVPARKAFRRGDPDSAVRIFGDAVFGRGGFERMPAHGRRQVEDNVSNVKAELLGSGFAPLSDEALRALRVPALLVTAERSVPLFQCLVERLAELLPDTQRAQVPGASHAMHDDNPDAFNAAVLRFIDGLA